MNEVEEKRHEAVLDFIKKYSSTYEMDENGDTGTEYAKVVIVKAFEDHKERGHVEDEPSIIPAMAKICVDADLDGEYQDMVKESTVRMLKDMLGQLEKPPLKPYDLIKEEHYDRNIYVFRREEDNVIVGVNFHQGVGDVIEDYTKPCPYLSNIYNNLVHFSDHVEDDDFTDIQRIHRAIDLYNSTNVFPPHTTINIPEPQLEIVREALEVYKNAITMANRYIENDELNSKCFDITGLLGMFSHEVVVNLSKEEVDKFCSNHNVDIPEYN